MPTLVAMVRSGEAFITRSERHGLWLHVPPGAGGAGPVDDRTAGRAVADHGFSLIERDFESWPELERFVQQEAAQFAPPVAIDPAELDGEDVDEMLDVARRWAAVGNSVQGHRLLVKLLRVPAVLADSSLHERIVAMLEAVGETGVVVSLRTEPTDPRKAEARRRLRDVPAA